MFFRFSYLIWVLFKLVQRFQNFSYCSTEQLLHIRGIGDSKAKALSELASNDQLTAEEKIDLLTR